MTGFHLFVARSVASENFTDIFWTSLKVNFVPPRVPLHPHVFSNGDICLSILTKDWAPTLHVQGVCLSVLSMLSSCKSKVQSRSIGFGSRHKRCALAIRKAMPVRAVRRVVYERWCGNWRRMFFLPQKLPPDNTHYLHMARTAPHKYHWSYYSKFIEVDSSLCGSFYS